MGTTLPPDIYRDWAQGVITSLRAEEIPANASPRGLNSALVSVGGGRCVVGKRRGGALVNTDTVVDGSSVAREIRGLTAFYHTASDTLYRLLTTDDGRLRRLLDDGTHTSVSATFLTADADPPVWATLNDRLFVANGTDQKKVIAISGTLTPQNVGITRPTVGSFAGVAGAAGTPNGTYDVVVTFFSANTGHESSRSDSISVVLTSDRLDLSNIPVSIDTQVTGRYIYARNTSTQTAFYRIHTIADNTATTATGIEWTDANVTIEAPDTAENDPPPTGLKGFISHGQRLFAWDDENLYYSGLATLGKIESFDPEALEPVKPSDGQKIIGCWEVNDNTLVIFKERSIYGLFGDDPNEWTVELIDPSVGLTSPHAVDTIEGITYFISQLGPMAWRFGSVPEQIGIARVAPDVDSTVLNATLLTRALVIADPPRQRVMFCLPSASSNEIDFILPYNYRLQVFEGRWEAFDIASAVRMKDDASREFVYFGGHYGKVFKWWAADTDGARTSDGGATTFTLQTTVDTSVSTTEFTVPSTGDSAVDLDDANLPGLYVYLFDADALTYERRRIDTADATTGTITVASAFADDPVVGRTVVIAGPIFELDTKWNDSGDPFLMKRYMQAFISGVCDTGSTTAYLDLFTGSTTAEVKRTWSFTVAGQGALFDVSQFDVDVFAYDSISTMKRRAATTGRNYRLRVRHIEPDRQFVVTALGMTAHTRNYHS